MGNGGQGGPETSGKADKSESPRLTAQAVDGSAPWGALIDRGPVDWQLIQQDGRGFGRISLTGRWAAKESMGLLGAGGGEVQVRIVRETTGSPVHDGFAWFPAATCADGSWSAEVEDLPAGGPYRLETRFSPKGNKLGEWSLRGDMRHFLGVGDIWLVAGQSNATGYGRAPAGDGPELGLHAFRQHGEWALASHPLHDSTDSIFPASRENYNAGHSPFLHFARLLRDELHHPIALVAAGLGGSPLEAWHPERGPLFHNMAAMVAKAGGRVRGMIWCQGESDAEAGFAETYLDRFLEAADGWRRALGHADLPILTVQLGRYRSRNAGEEDREWSLVREAQRTAPSRRKGISVVPALDLPLDDTIHFGTAGNLVLADRLARCALGTVYGKRMEYRAPDLVEAAIKGDRILELRFAPVLSRLDTYHPKALPYRVEDADGVAGVESAVYYRRDTVRLFVARPLRGPVTVSCGYGEDPDTLPLDVERQMPILACHGFPAVLP